MYKTLASLATLHLVGAAKLNKPGHSVHPTGYSSILAQVKSQYVSCADEPSFEDFLEGAAEEVEYQWDYVDVNADGLVTVGDILELEQQYSDFTEEELAELEQALEEEFAEFDLTGDLALTKDEWIYSLAGFDYHTCYGVNYEGFNFVENRDFENHPEWEDEGGYPGDSH